MRSNQPLRDPPGRVRARVRPQAELEEPILAELFSVERLEEHAQTLAAAQAVTDAPRRGHAVLPRTAENGRVLLESYRVLARAIKDERSITPAAEWLVDNFHIVDEQFREIRDDLPRTTTASCPSWPMATSRATPGSWVSPSDQGGAGPRRSRPSRARRGASRWTAMSVRGQGRQMQT